MLGADAFAPLPNAAPATRLTTMALTRSAPPAIMAARVAPKKKVKAVVKKVAPKPKPKPKKVVKRVVKKVVKKKVVVAAKKKPVARKAPPKPKPRPKPRPVTRVAAKKQQSFAFGKMQARAKPKLAKSNPYRNKGTAIVAGGGEANPGGAAFAAFFLFLPWVGIFYKAGYIG